MNGTTREEANVLSYVGNQPVVARLKEQWYFLSTGVHVLDLTLVSVLFLYLFQSSGDVFSVEEDVSIDTRV